MRRFSEGGSLIDMSSDEVSASADRAAVGARTAVAVRRARVSTLAAILLVAALSALSAPKAQADSKFIDPEDGAFDLSDLLLSHRGVLPVPTLITEPAVGYGLGCTSRCQKRPPPMRRTVH
jgi:hypothetical protein